MNATITAIDYYLPQKVLINSELRKRFPSLTPQEEQLLGIQSRRIVSETETASDLAIKAAKQLFDNNEIKQSEIDYLLFCAQEFDYYTPTTACVIQDRLGLSNSIGAFDFNLGCSGFVYGLSIAKAMIESQIATNVLLLTSSTLTKKIHPGDKNSSFLFGDGAAATLITNSENDGVGSFVFGTDGKTHNNIIVKDGGGRNPITKESNIEKQDRYGNTYSDAHFFMNGISVFSFSLDRVPRMIQELLNKENLSIDEIDLFVFHQANRFILEKLRKKLGILPEKFVISLEHTGNTVSSTIPIALYEAIKEGRAQKGQKILLAGFGVGLSWGATIVTL